MSGVLTLLAFTAFTVLSLVQAGAGIGARSGEQLVLAARNQNEEAFRALLRQGADVNAAQADGATALHWAAHWDNGEFVDLLIRAGAALNAENDHGATPLWLACVNGSASIIERLLAAGADPNARLASRETPLMTASRTGSLAAVTALLSHGATVNAKGGSRGQTALMWAAAQRHSGVVQVLINGGADINARSDVWYQLVNSSGYGDDSGAMDMPHGGSTPLLFATRADDVKTLGILLAAGANVNDTAPAGTSALVLASHSGYTETAKFLLNRGADVDASEAGYTALHAAVLRGDLELVETLLAYGADPNATVTRGSPGRRESADYHLDFDWIGTTPFWLAAKFAEIDIMRILAAKNADPMITSKDGTTALMEAMGVPGADRRGRRPVSEWSPGEEEHATLEAATISVELGVDVNAVSKAGDTALHRAAERGYNPVVQFLADSGATLDVPNKKEQTPLTLADQLPEPEDGQESTAELLRRLGARE